MRIISTLLLVITLTFTSCFVSSPQIYNIEKEYDVVKDTKREKVTMYHYKSLERGTPFFSTTQTFLVQTDSTNTKTVRIWEKFKVSNESYELKKEVYFIFDQNDIVKAPIDDFRKRIKSDIDENTETIMDADSNEVTVTTGYNINTNKLYFIEYTQDDALLKKILNARTFDIRYYCGPHMITVRTEGDKLRQLQSFLR